MSFDPRWFDPRWTSQWRGPRVPNVASKRVPATTGGSAAALAPGLHQSRTGLFECPARLRVGSDKDGARFAGATVGIDLGTAFSAVGVWRGDGVEILANEHGSRLTPSCVGFLEGRAIVGEAAVQLAHEQPDTVVFGAKRLMGQAAGQVAPMVADAHWPFTVRLRKQVSRYLISLQVGCLVAE